jgi:hypothetical protein
VRRRWIAVLILLVIVAGAALAAWTWWRSTAPRQARLLPDADGYFYVDLETLRRAGAIDELPPVSEDPEYRDFIQATGFRFERDVNSAAFAIHGQLDFDAAALETLRFSEVLNGAIDRQRATAFLRKIAQQTATYRDREVFYIPHQGRTVRATFLDDHNVAISNTDTDAALHAIIEKFADRGPVAPSSMLREFYSEVPVGSLAWLVTKVSAAPSLRRGPLLSSELRRILGGSTMIASLRFITALDLRLEAVAPSQDKASEISQNAGTFLQLYGLAQQQTGAGGSDPDIKAALKSLQVEQQGQRVLLTASIPPRVLKKLAQ